MPQINPRLLIFDLDGTLVDSAPDIILTVNALLDARGKPHLPDAQIIRAIGYGLKKTIFDLFPETHSDPRAHAELEAEFFSFYEKHLLNQTRPYPGVMEFLENRDLDVKIAIVTNKYVHLATKLIHHLPLGKMEWVAILGADSLPRGKPDPMPLLEVMKLAHVSPRETVMIGDGIPDMQAAAAAGVPAIACAFGYTPLQSLKNAGATHVLRGFSELSALLSNLEKQANN